jgi:hypothetical protein
VHRAFPNLLKPKLFKLAGAHYRYQYRNSWTLLRVLLRVSQVGADWHNTCAHSISSTAASYRSVWKLRIDGMIHIVVCAVSSR